jgi:hypothetical protein
MFRGNPNDNDEIFNLTVELAKNGNFKAQKDLIDAYEKGWFMEKNATRIEYLTKISECFKESNETQNCQR